MIQDGITSLILSHSGIRGSSRCGGCHVPCCPTQTPAFYPQRPLMCSCFAARLRLCGWTFPLKTISSPASAFQGTCERSASIPKILPPHQAARVQIRTTMSFAAYSFPSRVAAIWLIISSSLRRNLISTLREAPLSTLPSSARIGAL